MNKTIRELLNEQYVILILMLGLSFVLYAQTMFYPFFIFDDPAQIQNNYYMQNVSLYQMFSYWKFSKTPLIFNVWQVIAKLFGTHSAFYYRLPNIFFHGLNAFLVVYLLRKVLSHFEKEENLLFPSLLGGVLFIIHPTQVESVVWVSNLRGILSTTFGLGTLVLYFQLSRLDSLYEKNITRYFFVFIFYLLGLLVKPGIAAVPALMIVYDRVLYQRVWKDIAYRNAPFLILAGFYIIIHLISTFKNYYIHAPLVTNRIFIALDAAKFYIYKAFVPFDLTFDYQRSVTKIALMMQDQMEVMILMVFGITIISLVAFCLLKKQYKPVFVGLISFFVLISVNLGFVPFVFQNISTVADRYFYLPLFGIAIIFSWLLVLANRQSKQINKIFLFGFIGMSMGLMLGSSFKQSRFWSSNHKILKQAYNREGSSFVVNISLANAYFDAGLLEESEKVLLDARREHPDSAEVYSNLLKVYQHLGKAEEIKFILKELKIRNIPMTYHLKLELAYTFANQTRYRDAFKLLNELLVDFPKMIDTQSLIDSMKDSYLQKKANHFISLSKMYEDEGNVKEAQKYRRLGEKVKKESLNIWKAINIFDK